MLGRAADVLRAGYRRSATGPDRFGLVHADMRLANLLVDGDERASCLDFDDCGWGWYLYDLGAALSFVEDSPLVPELVDAWVRGTGREAELTATEWRSAGRSCCCAGCCSWPGSARTARRRPGAGHGRGVHAGELRPRRDLARRAVPRELTRRAERRVSRPAGAGRRTRRPCRRAGSTCPHRRPAPRPAQTPAALRRRRCVAARVVPGCCRRSETSTCTRSGSRWMATFGADAACTTAFVTSSLRSSVTVSASAASRQLSSGGPGEGAGAGDGAGSPGKPGVDPVGESRARRSPRRAGPAPARTSVTSRSVATVFST